jgi:hypothetical protein
VDRFLRHATLVVLLFLAFVVWFETALFGGDRGAVRLVVGVLCVYVAVQSLERQKLQDAFKQILQAFQQYRAGNQTAAAGVTTSPTARERREAVEILIAALRRGGPTADVAISNLRRVTGQDHGRDAEAWQRWLDGQPRE